MRRLSVALIANAVWVLAVLVAAAAVMLLGTTLLTLIVATLICVAAFAASAFIGLRADGAFADKLAAIGGAVGLKEQDARSVEAIVASLGQRLDRAHQFKAAFQRLKHPALLIGADGQLSGLTAGAEALDRHAVEGSSASELLGASHTADEGLV